MDQIYTGQSRTSSLFTDYLSVMLRMHWLKLLTNYLQAVATCIDEASIH